MRRSRILLSPWAGIVDGPGSGAHLTKWLAKQGLFSRREGENYVRQGFVLVNGATAQLGQVVDTEDQVHVMDAALKQQNRKFTFLVNKPLGYVSGQPKPGKIPAVRLLEDLHNCADNALQAKLSALERHDYLQGLAHCGRLDEYSAGLLVLSQDGRIARQLLTRTLEKEYLVVVSDRATVGEEQLRAMRDGSMRLDGKQLWPCEIQNTPYRDQFRIILKQGMFRQIRRMFDKVGVGVLQLERTRIGNVRLDIPQGTFRELRPNESFS